MPDLHLCPTDATLRSLLLGSYPGRDADALGDHLLACPACGAKAERLVANDPLLADLRAAHDTSELGTDGTFVEELLRRVKGLANKPAPNADLAFLGPPQQPGDLGTLDGYRIVEVLGQGGMGMVFKAIDPTLKRTVALKIILPKYADNIKLRERFVEEAQATARVRSQHVAEVYHVAVWQNVSYQTMELLAGQTLDKRPRPMPTEAWRRIAHGIAKGLSDAHRVGLVHRDLKPSNIHLGTDARTGKPTVKIIDFGLARPVNRDIEVTKSGELLGTPAYMSPEQARGKKVDHRTDLYSLGVILHQLATGHLPYLNASEGVFAILTELATPEPLPSVTNLATNLPPILASLIDRLLAKDPANRPASADEVMKILKDSLTTEKLPASTEVVASAPYVSISDIGSVAPTAATPVPFGDLPTSPLTAASPVPAPLKRRRVWLLPAVGLGVLAAGLLIAYAAGLFVKVKTPNGTIEIADLDAGAEVFVDGEEVTVRWEDGKRVAVVAVPAGTRTVEVRVDGVVVSGEKVTVANGERKPMKFEFKKDGDDPPAAAARKPAPPEPKPAAAVETSDELVVNGDCSQANLKGWEVVSGRWFQKNPGGDPIFCAGNCKEGTLKQDVDVSKHAADIDAGRVDFRAAVALSSFDADRSHFRVAFLDKDGKVISVGYDTGERAHRMAWVEYVQTVAAPAGTRTASITLRSILSPRPGNKECSGYFDNVSLKALVKKPVAAPPPRTETRVLGGQWRQAADRLFLARDAAMYFPQVAFGDRNWTDYDFTVQARRVLPAAHQFGLCFRSNGQENQDTFSLGAFGNTLYQAEENKGGKWNQMQTRKAALKLNVWYTATVKVRGNKFECLLAEGDAPAETIFRGTTSHPRGQVGLVVFKTGGYLFRNIKVTAPNGDALWDGLPEVEKVATVPDNLTAGEPTPPATPGFAPLFNGKDTAGWETRGNASASWKVENGTLVGSWPNPKDAAGGGSLVTAKADYRHFHLRLRAMKSEVWASRIFVLTGGRPDGGGGRYRVWLGSPKGVAGEEVGRLDFDGGASTPLLAAPQIGPNTWFTLEVIVLGNRIQVLVDGRTTADFTDPNMPAAGDRIKLHLAGGGAVRFQSIEVQDLAPPNAAAAGFTPLFNGKDLTGWEPHPTYPGKWEVKDGVLQGRATAGPAGRQPVSYLRTARKDYTDFHFRAEARINRGGGGGIFFRVGDGGEVFPSATDRWINGYKVDIEAKRGKTPTWTGGLMSGNYVLSPPKDPPVVPGEWFVLDVIVSGREFTVKVNDGVVNRYTDTVRRSAKGFISLEAYLPTSLIEFRKVEVRELAPAAAPSPPTTPGFAKLFNGNDLTGWEKFGFPKAEWNVEGGVLIGKCPANNNNDGSNLVTLKKDYRNFHLKLRAMKPASDTRRYTSRVVFLPGAKDDGVNGYFRVSLGSPDDANGKEVGRLSRGKNDPLPLLASPKVAADGWYTLELIVQGNRVQVLVDGTKTADVTDDAMPKEGHPINLTCAQDGEVRIQSVEIQELPAPKPAAVVPPTPPAVSPTPPKAAGGPVDPFAEGTVWRGVRVIEDGTTPGESVLYQLTIDTRTSTAFTGSVEIEAFSQFPAKVAGTITADAVEWKEVPKFHPLDSTAAIGSLRDGMLVLTTKGRYAPGRGTTGRAKLFRELRPNEPPGDQFYPLFNGRTLDDWETHFRQTDGWAVKGGRLVGAKSTLSHLYTKQEYGDVHVWCRAKVGDGGRGGVVAKSSYGPGRNEFPVGYKGLLTADDPKHPAGSLDASGTVTAARGDRIKAKEWFDLDLIAKGDAVRVLVNGKETAAATDPAAAGRRGRIALQVEQAITEIEFAMIAVKELKP